MLKKTFISFLLLSIFQPLSLIGEEISPTSIKSTTLKRGHGRGGHRHSNDRGQRGLLQEKITKLEEDNSTIKSQLAVIESELITLTKELVATKETLKTINKK